MAKQAKTATQLGRQCEWSLFEPATASRSESAAQTTALQESTPNVTVGNAVSVLLHDKEKTLGLPFLSREKNRAPPPSCKRRSFVNHSISTGETGRAPCPVSYSNPVYASHLFTIESAGASARHRTKTRLKSSAVMSSDHHTSFTFVLSWSW